MKKAQEKALALGDVEKKIEQKDEEGEDLAGILAEEAAAEMSFKKKKESLGIENPETIQAAIRLLDAWILLYKLKPMDDLISEIFPIVKQFTPESSNHNLFIKTLQLKAFMRYKQFKHREALDLFYEFKELVGPSPELLENMGHTHNVVGEHEQALKCFQDALQIYNIREQLDPQFQRDRVVGGVLLGIGIGTTYKSMKKYEEALDYMNQALESFKRRMHGKDHSLVAKTLTGIGATQTSMQNFKGAYDTYVEAVRIFKVTCGLSPLTANSLFDVACAAKKLGKVKESVKALEESLDMHVDFDTLDMPKIIMVLNTILEVKPQLINTRYPDEKGPVLTLHEAFGLYKPMLDRCFANMTKQSIAEDDNAAVYFKACGEILVLGGFHMDAVQALSRAANHFRSVTYLDCSGLIKQCEDLSKIAVNLMVEAQKK